MESLAELLRRLAFVTTHGPGDRAIAILRKTRWRKRYLIGILFDLKAKNVSKFECDIFRRALDNAGRIT